MAYISNIIEACSLGFPKNIIIMVCKKASLVTKHEA